MLNRGVEKRDVVLDDGDRMRFVRSLYVLNDSKSVPNGITQQGYWKDMSRPRDCLVYIHCWCLMNNHYHLLVSPVDDDLTKLSMFMKKLNMGYARFFNEKYDRSGYLWQGKYKKVHIETDAHYLYIPFYIHLNPLDYSYAEWRSGTLENVDEAVSFLDEYRWSSWQDYSGIRNFPSLLGDTTIQELVGDRETQNKTTKRIVSDTSITRSSYIIET